MKARKKAASNIIATLLIASMITVSSGVLYSRIAPTLVQYNAESSSSNQELIFLAIENEINKLVLSSERAKSTVHLVAQDVVYHLNDQSLVKLLNLDFRSGTNNQTINTELSVFSAEVNQDFQSISEDNFFGNPVNENTFVNANFTDQDVFAVTSFDLEIGKATITMYYRIMVDLVKSFEQNYTLNVFSYSLEDSPGQLHSDFPYSRSEWTLALRRGATTITTYPSIDVADGNLTISQTVTGLNENLESYSYSLENQSHVSIRFIQIPVYFFIEST